MTLIEKEPMQNITPEEVKAAALAANIKRVDHHKCGACGSWVGFLISDENLFFDSNCQCTAYESTPHFAPWSEAVNWITTQRTPEEQVKAAKKFGLDLDETVVCGPCSEAGGADMPIEHKPPACEP